MRLFTARRLALAALVPALLLVCVIPGCSNEGEGERCGTTQADDSDCADGLVCVDAKTLLNAPLTTTFRCCYPGGVVNDSRCLSASGVGSGSVGGAGGSVATGGTSGAGTSSGGTSGGDSADAGDVTAAGAGGN